MRNNVRFFVSPKNFIKLIRGTTNNIIEIGYLDYGVTADAATENNDVVCSFRGEELEQIVIGDLDVGGNGNKFAYETIANTNKNIIKIAVDPLEVDSSEGAKKFISGLLIDYLLEDLVYSNSAQTPLYNFKASLSDGTIVSLSEACTMETIKKKMEALDKDASINKIGFYAYEIARAIVKK
jgi:hypothetical protein